VRDADDGNIYVKSARAGQRVLASVTRVLTRRLKVTVKAAKRAVDRPWRRTFLGFTFTGRRPNRRRVRGKALQACQHAVRQRTQRTRGVSLGRVAGDLRRYLDGWYASFGVAEAPSSFKALDSWIRVGCAVTSGSRGGGAGTGNGVAVGSAETWPGIRSRRPTGHGA
jgi:RNA-directed DNA polymerase